MVTFVHQTKNAKNALMQKKHITVADVNDDIRYLKLLAKQFPSVPSVTTEIINLQAILHLPKPTEHFLSDIHRDKLEFDQELRNAS